MISVHVPQSYNLTFQRIFQSMHSVAHPQYKLQDEVLFARGLKYRILSVDASGERVYIKAEVIKT